MTDITYGCTKSKVVQFRWVQLMRDVLDVSRDFIGHLPKFPQFLYRQTFVILGYSLFKFLESVRQQRHPLVDVVVQLARNSASFFLLRFRQPPAHPGRSFFGEFAIRDIDTRAYVTSKRTVAPESWHSGIENPAVLAVMPPHSVLHFERLACIERLYIGVQARRRVFRVDPFCPPVSKFRRKRPALSLCLKTW